jgi:hypothetical protein
LRPVPDQFLTKMCVGFVRAVVKWPNAARRIGNVGTVAYNPRNPAPQILGPSGDDWDDVTPAARWGARWRELQREAFEIALEMSDANAQRHMLFVAKSYALLAERAEERRKRLLALAAAKPRVRS